VLLASEDWAQLKNLEVSAYLTHKEESVRANAAVSLEYIGTQDKKVIAALLRAAGKEKDEAARDRIVAVLDLVTGAPHTRLLAESFEDGSAHVRSWSLRRAALFPDPGIREPAEATFSRLSKAVGSRKAPDREELLAGALAATSAGSTVGLGVVFERAIEDWGDVGRNIRIACEGARGEEASAQVVGYLTATEERAERVAAVRLLAGCGTQENAVPHLRPLLDSDDATIRIAAINALRGIVDGEMPVEKLSVFDSIELAKTWKQRIG